ncbi:MAG TPA: 4'-phosphopantetheinyl transferase superfamily protein, partial [Propylenella sp.]|nr:4'-phosphopantetheinyl transferase superfamily protein [Propylenella sp.]
ELYTTGMFHGPLYHSVSGLLGWDHAGIDAVLTDTPLDGFFEPGRRPRFVLNPVLLDAIGHVTAFWIAQSLGTDFSSFPSRIARIDLFDAGREDTAGSRISGRLGFEAGASGGRFLTGDFTCVGPDGQVLLRASGWRDRFFDVPNRFYFARWAPRDGFYGEDVSGLFGSLPGEALVWSVPSFPKGFLDDAGGIWRRVLANTVLSAEERLQWKALPGQQRRRDEWLIGRIALKEATRVWIERVHGYRLYPADVVIRVAEGGKPYVAMEGLEAFGELPEVSLAHVEGEAVAVAAPPGIPVGIDLERAGRIKTPDLLAGGFSDLETNRLFGTGSDPARVLQAWCAKEAAAKCLGEGLNGRPKNFIVSAMDEYGNAQVDAGSGILRVALAADGASMLAVAWRAET